MVGLVLVSHSRALAEALRSLVNQVSPVALPVAIAAGIGEKRQEFGTDALEIAQAIQEVMTDEGVLVLMDLGSAVLSAQLAAELLPPNLSAKVNFCAAPIVEGAIAAGVQIGLGSSLEAVCAEANLALLPKQHQVGGAAPEAGATAEALAAGEALTVTLTLTNLHGLHARPAARFVHTAASFESLVQVENLTNHKGPVSARSLNAVATLGAVGGHQVRLSASGADASNALQALQALIESGFGEAAAEAPTTPATPIQAAGGEGPQLSVSATYRATPVSDGVALAPLYRYQPPLPEISNRPARDLEAEWNHLLAALKQAQDEIRQRARQLKQVLKAEDAAIFDAHLLILQDPDLLQAARQGVYEKRQNASEAWYSAFSAVAQAYRDLEDVYLQQRALDVEDVGRQVLFALAGKPASAIIKLTKPVILYAPDLTPTETSQLDMKQVLGIITAGGGPTSHSAILARALGIPALAGVPAALFSSPGKKSAALVGINGFSGELWIDPPEDVRAHLMEQRGSWQEGLKRLLATSRDPAITQDGKRIEVFANVGNVADAQAAVQNGAEGIGLLRTEFLFLTRQTPPTEDEQAALLRQIFETLHPHPVTVRTLDVGGDKNLPYIHLPTEANPFLGVRALRLSLSQPEMFMTQLRAILRAAVGAPCRIMFPMVADASEVRQARQWLEKAHAELQAEKTPHAWPVEMGIMVEIPSAALLSASLAEEVDFFSIGTNDLTQYTLAAERGNPQLAHLADGLHPAVLRLIQQVADGAHRAGKWAGICGELGGDPKAVPILVGLGIDELSLNPAGIPRVKTIVRGLSLPQAAALAEKALLLQTSAEVRALAGEFSK